MEKFKKWKSELHHGAICQFVRQGKWSNNKEEVVHYRCHRSGSAKIKEKHLRKRLLKMSGSKRLGGTCPAQIIMRYNRMDNTCTVRYQKTHVGHEIGTEDEMKHMYIEENEKLVIASNLLLGVSTTETLRKQRMSNNSKENSIPLDISLDDVHDVMKHYGTDENDLAFGNDSVSVNAIVTENRDSILFFKDKSEKDEMYSLLDINDFMIVIMNAAQEEYLRRYGCKIVAFDGTHHTNPAGFILHSMFVLDVDFEGFPVAFALTNRDDYRGIRVFFQCIREKIGTAIKPNVLMSDMQPTYLNEWNNVMLQPERQLYCSWHVLDSWKRNFKKIKNEMKRDAVKKAVFAIFHETDPILFEEKLMKFLSNSDDDIENFVKYFEAYYASCPKKWAYCYHREAGVTTNTHIERFHGILKKNIARNKKIKSVYSCLQFLFEYLQVKEKAELCKHICGKISSKLRTLRQRHRSAEAQLLNSPIMIQPSSNMTTWFISSFKDNSKITQEMYIVSQQDPVECTLYDNKPCQLVCTLCDMCFHQYKCTCPDSSIRNNMCKHIHVLGIYLLQANDCIYSTDDAGVEIDCTSLGGIVSEDTDNFIQLEGNLYFLAMITLNPKTKKNCGNWQRIFSH